MNFDSYITSHCAYFKDGFDYGFQKNYKGVIVNGINDFNEGHFAIRKPITFWFKLPKFIQKMFPYRWIMYKNRIEKMYQLIFKDSEYSIEMIADLKNPSYKKLTFDFDTYWDLKENLPDFLKTVGFKFNETDSEDNLVIEFE